VGMRNAAAMRRTIISSLRAGGTWLAPSSPNVGRGRRSCHAAGCAWSLEAAPRTPQRARRSLRRIKISKFRSVQFQDLMLR